MVYTLDRWVGGFNKMSVPLGTRQLGVMAGLILKYSWGGNEHAIHKLCKIDAERVWSISA